MASRERFPLPRGWTKTVRSSVLHAVSFASAALTLAWAKAARNRRPKVQLVAELERGKTEIALIKEELSIKDGRWSRVPPRRRPYYGPIQRMRILRLKAARSWSTSQTAHVFLVTEETITSWLKRIDEEGERSLVQIAEPVNKFPDYVGYLVRWLKSVCPTMGKVGISQTLARAGLRLGATTVGRMLREDTPEKEPDELTLHQESPPSAGRVVSAKYADHNWHVDLSIIPTAAGFWVPWLPFSKPLRWPFCWWIAVVIDQFSRRLNGFALFKEPPSSVEVCEFLDRVMERTESRPKHVITDKGCQFFCDRFKAWCREHGMRPRFGAVGRKGSIAIIERFFRSLKVECTRRIPVPFGVESMRREIASYATWYNSHRPHQALDGLTPSEVHNGESHSATTLELRSGWPERHDEERERVKRVHVVIKFMDARRHLPIVELKRAA